MKISVKSLTALVFFATTCLVGVATILIVQSMVTNQIIFEAQERVKEHLSSARWVYNAKIREIDQLIRLTSIRHGLKKGLKERSLLMVRGELSALMAQEGLDFMTLTDGKGTVLSRFHNPRASGDSLIDDPFTKKGLEKKSISGTQILSREELMREGETLAKKASLVLIPTPKEKPTGKTEETSGMVLKSAHPVLDFNGDLLGVLEGGILLNRRIIFFFFLFSMSGMLIAFAISFILSWKILKKSAT